MIIYLQLTELRKEVSMNKRKRTYTSGETDPYSTLGTAGPIFGMKDGEPDAIVLFDGSNIGSESSMSTGVSSTYYTNGMGSDLDGYIYLNVRKNSSNEIYKSKWSGSSLGSFSKVGTLDGSYNLYPVSNAYEVRIGDYSSKGLTDEGPVSYRAPYLDRYMVSAPINKYVTGKGYIDVMYIRNSVTNTYKMLILPTGYSDGMSYQARLPEYTTSGYMDRIILVYVSGNQVKLLEYKGDPEELTDSGSIEFEEVLNFTYTPFMTNVSTVESICIDNNNIYLGFYEYYSAISARPYFCRFFVIGKDYSYVKVVPKNGILDSSGSNTSVGSPDSHVVSDGYTIIATDSVSTGGNSCAAFVQDLGNFDVDISAFTDVTRSSLFHIPIWRYDIKV